MERPIPHGLLSVGVANDGTGIGAMGLRPHEEDGARCVPAALCEPNLVIPSEHPIRCRSGKFFLTCGVSVVGIHAVPGI